MHTTNYFNTFIQLAEDCPVCAAEIPPLKKEKSIANLQFEMIERNPYRFTSDEIIFGVFAIRNTLGDNQEEREKFFSKGQACLRASPLAKRYGWGIHNDAEGKVAIYPVESEDYQKLASDQNLKQVKAMRSRKA